MCACVYARQVRHPSELLRGLHIVDTPGTNAVVQGHQQITESIVPRADLIVFVTSADRPFSDSERLFLGKIWNWRKKVVVVVNVGALRVRRTCSCARKSCVLPLCERRSSTLFAAARRQSRCCRLSSPAPVSF